MTTCRNSAPGNGAGSADNSKKRKKRSVEGDVPEKEVLGVTGSDGVFKGIERGGENRREN